MPRRRDGFKGGLLDKYNSTIKAPFIFFKYCALFNLRRIEINTAFTRSLFEGYYFIASEIGDDLSIQSRPSWRIMAILKILDIIITLEGFSFVSTTAIRSSLSVISPVV